MSLAQQLLTELKMHPELADALSKQIGKAHAASVKKSKPPKKKVPSDNPAASDTTSAGPSDTTSSSDTAPPDTGSPKDQQPV